MQREEERERKRERKRQRYESINEPTNVSKLKKKKKRERKRMGWQYMKATSKKQLRFVVPFRNTSRNVISISLPLIPNTDRIPVGGN